MSDKNQRTLTERLESFVKQLKKTGESLENSFEKLEKKLDKTFESTEKSMKRFESNIEKKFERLDTWFEEKESKLEHILETNGLKKHFKVRHDRSKPDDGTVKAVDGVDIGIVRGETLGIVGESGCGKSTIARIMIGLVPPSEGKVHLFGCDVAKCSKETRKEIRRRTGIVFQDPYGSLNPRMTVADIVGEPLRAFKLYENKTDRLIKTLEILEACGMNADDLFKFPHQFSGGQRQRICIARALVTNPEIVVCDEAVSALDVSIQAQIINLLCDLRDEFGLTYIFISHDLDVVRFIADRIAVMYMGRVVELSSKKELFKNPLHPYTKALLESAPVFGRRTVDEPDEGNNNEILMTEAQPCGCQYCLRCPEALPECSVSEPQLCQVSDGHAVACYLFTPGGK